MCDDDIIEQLRLQADQSRKRATFFSWHDKSPQGKEVAETGAVRTLLEAMASAGPSEYANARPSGDAWPDCVADGPDGATIALEVTELVDKTALPNGTPNPWTLEMVRDRLQAILAIKDRKSFGGGKYREIVLLIHTDELYIDAEAVTPVLREEVFTLPHGNVNRAFLLFSYDPKRHQYPFVELRLSA